MSCSVAECAGTTKALGLCNKHWLRWWRHGDLTRGREMSGARNPRWREGWVSYPTAHKRVRAERGSPKAYSCSHCDAEARQWAYDHRDPDELTDVVKNRKYEYQVKYSLDPNHYIPLCGVCHWRFDRMES